MHNSTSVIVVYFLFLLNFENITYIYNHYKQTSFFFSCLKNVIEKSVFAPIFTVEKKIKFIFIVRKF